MGIKIPSGNKIIGVIPARMASSRYYGKPLVKILGKEMIQWVYENSSASSILKDIYVATDHEDIVSFCKKKNIPCIITSALHKNCSERSNEVSQLLGADYVIEIQGDEPTLKTNEIDRLIIKCFEKKDFDFASLYTDLSPDIADNPHVVKVVIDKESKALFFSRSPIPYNFKSKPVKYYSTIGLFLWHADALKRFSEAPVSYLESIEDTHMLRLIENHFDLLMIYTPDKTIDVNIPEDVLMVEEMLSKNDNIYD